MPFLTISCSEKKLERLYTICNKLGITMDQFLDDALNDREVDALKTEAEKLGAWYWHDEE